MIIVLMIWRMGLWQKCLFSKYSGCGVIMAWREEIFDFDVDDGTKGKIVVLNIGIIDTDIEKMINDTIVSICFGDSIFSIEYVCFIAPTSSGKSSIVSEHIKKNETNKRSLIIVPSKSLLSQTYMDIRKNIIDRKIICHDEMYSGEERFVGILTQMWHGSISVYENG